MKRALLLLALLPVLASAQLQLYVAPQGGEETLFTGSYDMGSVAVADSASMRFRLRNTGRPRHARIPLCERHRFSASGAPSLPFIVAPGLNVDFTVRFSPKNFGSYSAEPAGESTDLSSGLRTRRRGHACERHGRALRRTDRLRARRARQHQLSYSGTYQQDHRASLDPGFNTDRKQLLHAEWQPGAGYSAARRIEPF